MSTFPILQRSSLGWADLHQPHVLRELAVVAISLLAAWFIGTRIAPKLIAQVQLTLGWQALPGAVFAYRPRSQCLSG
jgi:hypothetical protein